MSERCAASRHVELIAATLARGETYSMIEDDPPAVADSLQAVVQSLWKARADNARLREAINTPMRGPEIIEVGKAIHRYIEAESTVHVGAIAHDAAITVANIIRARALKERGDE